MASLLFRPALRLPRTQHLAHHLRRFDSTTPHSTPHSTPTVTTSPPRSALRPTRRFLLYASLGFFFGGTLGSLLTHTIAPPPHPEPGSPSDKILLHDLETRIDNEFKVRVLRGKCTAAAANLRGESGDWVELDSTSSAKATSAEEQSREANRLLTEAMAGARGLGTERVFWNKREKELVAVVWFGGALSGWPGVVHGGSIATVLGEKSAVAARLLGRAGLEDDVYTGTTTGGSIGEGATLEPKQLELTYKKPTYGNAFYVVRVVPRLAGTDGLGTLDKNLGREVEVEGRLETLDGKLCVETKALVSIAGGFGIGADEAKATKAGSWTGWVGQG